MGGFVLLPASLLAGEGLSHRINGGGDHDLLRAQRNPADSTNSSC